jgi:hypothetical protein
VRLYFPLHVSVTNIDHQQVEDRNRRKSARERKNKSQTYIADVFVWIVFASDLPTREDDDVQNRL